MQTEILPTMIKQTVFEPITSLELAQEREKLGISMAEACRICRVPYRTWQNWENGSRPTPTFAMTLIEFLQYKVNESPMDSILVSN